VQIKIDGHATSATSTLKVSAGKGFGIIPDVTSLNEARVRAIERIWRRSIAEDNKFHDQKSDFCHGMISSAASQGKSGNPIKDQSSSKATACLIS
jgi:hypothetical protein